MTIRSRRRQLRSTFAWALTLASLVLGASLITAVFRDTPDHVAAALVLCAFVAAGVGVFLNWRLNSAHSEALRDPLTGLPNRVLLDDRIEQAFRRSRRSGEPFTLIAIDLDGFKDVNDVRGHRAGDLVLKALARRFEAIVRESDTVARVGGDEFVILSMGTGSDERAGALVGRLQNALRRPFRVEGAAVEIDGSIGFSVFPDDGSTAEELLTRADGQMYATKRDTSDENVLLRRGVDAGIVRDVESALEKNELLVVYQPILELATGMPRSAEALIRRMLPDGGLVPPAEFVPHVERTPLVRELTFLVVADALDSAQQWAKAGHDLGVSINIPYRLLDDSQFADGLTELLRTVDPTSPQVTLEVVPSGPGAGTQVDEEILGRFDALGVRLVAGRRRPRGLVRRASRAAARRAQDRRRVRPRARAEPHRRGPRPRDDRHRARARAHGRGRGRRDPGSVEGAPRVGLRLRARLLRREPPPRRRARRVARRQLARRRLTRSD